VNKNVTTPEGGPPADTRTGCHTKAHFNAAIGTDIRCTPTPPRYRSGVPAPEQSPAMPIGFMDGSALRLLLPNPNEVA
jgi:hypothetical protein